MIILEALSAGLDSQKMLYKLSCHYHLLFTVILHALST